jgi:hypothetical protein
MFYCCTALTVVLTAPRRGRWQEVDASDASFLTSSRLNVVNMLLQHPDINLCTMNTPNASLNGVIPLGMAAWLNAPAIVELLLDRSSDSVSVDGMDSQGATALMCRFYSLLAR